MGSFVRLVVFLSLLGACSSAPPIPPADMAPPPPDLAPAPPPFACRAEVAGGAPFGPALVISDPANASVVPVVAARERRVLVAWHAFSGMATHVAYTLVQDGCVGPLRMVAEPLERPIQPSVAATADGFVIAYHAGNGPTQVRAVWLSPDGDVTGGPEPVGDGGYPRVAAAAGRTAFAWLDDTGHAFAVRGPDAVPATHVPNTVNSRVVGAAPRVAIDAEGNIFLAYRDGSSVDQEVFLLVRPSGGAFQPLINVSESPGLLSDDVTLAVEPDGTLDVVWVDQDPVDVNSFEVHHRRRSPGGVLGDAERYGTQGLWSWTPSVVPGLAAAWRTGAGATGPFYFSDGTQAPVAILPGQTGSLLSLARTADGALHLAFQDGEMPRRIHYARRLP